MALVNEDTVTECGDRERCMAGLRNIPKPHRDIDMDISIDI